MADAADHDVRKDFQLISDYITTKVAKDEKKPKHDEIPAHDALLFQAGLHIVFSVVSSLARIAAALERIADNTRKDGMLQ